MKLIGLPNDLFINIASDFGLPIFHFY